MPWWNAKDPTKRKPPRIGARNNETWRVAILLSNSGPHSAERIEMNRQVHIGIPSPLKGKTQVEILGEERAEKKLALCLAASHKAAEMVRGKKLSEIFGTERALEISIRKGNSKRLTHELTKNQNTRDDYRYHEWTQAVKKRDNYICQHCNAAPKDIHAHHIKPWQACPSLRYEVQNGIALCNSCHRKEHFRMKEEALLLLLNILASSTDPIVIEGSERVRIAFDIPKDIDPGTQFTCDLPADVRLVNTQV